VHVPAPDNPVSYSAAYRNFKLLLREAGLNPDLFGLHSPRIGGATDAFYNKVPHHVIDAQGRWRDPKTKMGYLRLLENRFVHALQGATNY